MRDLRPIPILLRGLLLGATVLLAPAVAWQEPLKTPVINGEIEVWPPVGTTIPIDGVILLEGSGSYRETIARAAGNAILEHQGRGVKLNVLQMGPGEHRGTFQALLQPAVPLDANTEYTLRLALGAPTYQILLPRIRQPGGERAPARWKSGPYLDPQVARPAPALEGEVLRVIACRLSDRENGLDLAARVPGAAEHSLIQVRLYRAGEGRVETAALGECLSRGWRGGRETTSFRTCSLSPELPPTRLRIELRPLGARGRVGPTVTIERDWRPSEPRVRSGG